MTDWTPTLADVRAARHFMLDLALTGPLADGCERRMRHIAEKIRPVKLSPIPTNFGFRGGFHLHTQSGLTAPWSPGADFDSGARQWQTFSHARSKTQTSTSRAYYEKAMYDLAAQGVWLTKRGRWGTRFAVRFYRAAPSTAYITDDLEDAIKHGRAMAKAGPPPRERTRPGAKS